MLWLRFAVPTASAHECSWAFICFLKEEKNKSSRGEHDLGLRLDALASLRCANRISSVRMLFRTERGALGSGVQGLKCRVCTCWGIRRRKVVAIPGLEPGTPAL